MCVLVLAGGRSAGAAGTGQLSATGLVSWDFVALGATSDPKVVRASNTGGAPLTVTKLVLRNPYDFGINDDQCSGVTLAPGASCTVALVFHPTTAGTRIGNLQFLDGSGCGDYVLLAGSGTAPVAQAAAACDGATASPPASGSTPATAPVSARSVIGLPTTCVSRRTLRVHLTAPAGQTFKRVTFRLRGKVIKMLSGRKIATTVSLKGLPRGRFALKVTATTSAGHVVARTHHYVTCVANKG